LGITHDEAKQRLSKYGPNQLQTKKKGGSFATFPKQFKSPLIYILIFTAFISFFIGKTTNALVVFFVITTNAVMGFIQESRSKRTMESLKELSAPKTKVIRIQRRMEGFGRLIIVVVLVQIIFAFVVGRFVRGLPFYEIFMVALSQMVSSIPEW
jgi:Ca2+-transporting ATPase